MLLLFQSLIFVNVLLSIKGNPPNARIIFNFGTAIVFGFYLALQKPGISADYFNYLEIYDRWSSNYRNLYSWKGEWVFVLIVDFAKSINSFEIIYLLYGFLYAFLLSLGLYVVRNDLNLYAFYFLAFGFLGLSANVLSGIRYILVTFAIFLIFTIIFSKLKNNKSIFSIKTAVQLLPLCAFAHASHQTGIFAILFVLIILIFSKFRSPIEKIKLPLSHLIWALLLAILILFSLQFVFVFVINFFNLPFIRYSELFDSPDMNNATTINMLSRFLWFCLVLYIVASLPRRLEVVERFCYYALLLSTIFYLFSIVYEPLFRMSNMLVLIAAFCVLYLTRLVRGSVLITQSIILLSTTGLVIRVIRGGGEYGYTLNGF